MLEALLSVDRLAIKCGLRWLAWEFAIIGRESKMISAFES